MLFRMWPKICFDPEKPNATKFMMQLSLLVFLFVSVVQIVGSCASSQWGDNSQREKTFLAVKHRKVYIFLP